MRNKLLFVCSFIFFFIPLFSSLYSLHFSHSAVCSQQSDNEKFFIDSSIIRRKRSINIKLKKYFAKHLKYSKCFLSNIKYLQEFYYFSLKMQL